ncbi:putative dispersed gene family protein 1 (DGF-1) [Trypanosoma conorhini]|uniref:Putative dispersed gene family protein 1 (DGF-1) n=1 Tax=Trypanosoma conorhini TaxID=83891 RepID=A0A3R7KTM7_9TRYP|nr:putative dispersed gene family protein 1 (DGF-1) [Trypanosoma conorhini]RNF13271.1 putative dispersed gene family protein 1 (DGF-1) [Trypanosoma conorhini]
MSTATLAGGRASVLRFADDDDDDDAERQERLRELRRDGEYERLLGSDGLAEALMYGASTREDRIMQMDALVETQRKIPRRGGTAHVVVLSANALTMAIMASQLAMHRWRVTEAQTLTEATAVIQQQILRARKSGFTVGRAVAAASPPRTKSFTRGSQSAARATDGRGGQIRADETGEAAETASAASSVCSAEGEEPALNPPPDDMVARLVVVDVCTHEPFRDIVGHLRFYDREHNLGLIIALMLHENYDSHTPGMLRLPKHTITVAEAYGLGYDLVLRRCFDHAVVNFFTELFMSATGRWCSDMRARGVVGNYRGMRQILLENDEAGLRDSLRAGLEARDGSCNSADDLGILRALQNKHMSQTQASSVMLHPPELSMMSVRSAVGSAHPQQQRTQQLDSIFGVKDVLSQVMSPASSVKHVAKRLFRPSASQRDLHAGTMSSGREEGEEGERLYEDVLLEEKDEVETAVVAAYKEEVLRLLTELERSERTVFLLREEVTHLQEVVFSNTNFATISSRPSISFEDTALDNFTSISKEQQIIILRQRLLSVTEKLLAYETQQKLRQRERKKQEREDKGGREPHAAVEGIGTAGSEEDTQDFSSDAAAAMLQRMYSLGGFQTDRAGDRTQTSTPSWLFSINPGEEDTTNPRSETPPPTGEQQRQYEGRDARPRPSESDLSHRMEEKSTRLGERLLETLRTISTQRHRIAELEAQVQKGKREGRSRKKKKRAAESSDDDDDGGGGGQRRGESGGRVTNARRGKQGAPAAPRRDSSWVEAGWSTVSTKPPSTASAPDERSIAPAGGVQRVEPQAQPKHRQWEAGTKSPARAAPGRPKAAMQEPWGRSQARPEAPHTQGPRPVTQKGHAREPLKEKDDLTKLEEIFSTIAAAKACGDEEAAEQARSRARVVARRLAAQQLGAKGLKKTLQEVEAATHGRFDGSVDTLRRAHLEAVKTAEDVLKRGEEANAYSQAVLAAYATEQQLRRLPRAGVEQAATDGTREAGGHPGVATTYEENDLVDSYDSGGGGEGGARRAAAQGGSHPDLEVPSQGLRRPQQEKRDEEEQSLGKPRLKPYSVPEGKVALQPTQMVLPPDAVMDPRRAAEEESMRTLGLELCLDHHQTLMRFLRLVGGYDAALRSLLQEEAEESEGQIVKTLSRQGGKVGANFLISSDTALLARLAALLGDDESLSQASSTPQRERRPSFRGRRSSRSLSDSPRSVSGFLDTSTPRRRHRSSSSVTFRGPGELLAPEEVARLLNRQDVTAEEIPAWLLDLLDSGDAEAAAALQEDPNASQWVRDVLVSIEAARKERGRELTELLRKHRQKLMRERLERSRRARAARNRPGSSSSSDSGGSGGGGGSEAVTPTAGRAPLRRVLSPSAYRCNVPPGQLRSVLRFRSLRHQNVFRLEPNGDVATEVSRRLLRMQRRDAEEEEEERGVLPPVEARGLSREQQAQFQSVHGVSSSLPPPLEPPPPPPPGAAFVRGRGRFPARHGVPREALEEVDYSPFTPEELADRIMSYRLAFSRLQGGERLPAGATAVIPGFAIPVAAASMPPVSPSADGNTRGPLPHRQGSLEAYSSWVYGVPAEQLFPMLRGVEPEAGDAVVFLPACSYADGGGANVTRNIGNAFVRRMLARVDLFSSPATLAARRLNEQLRSAMPDWQMGVVGRSIAPATRGTRAQRPQ